MFRNHKSLYLFVLMLLAFTAAASAQNNDSYVAVNSGNDANPCDSASPCRSITKALTVTKAGGEIVLTESGNYEPVTIQMSVNISAANGVNASMVSYFLASSSVVTGPNLTAADTVSFRNIHFIGNDGSQNGIYGLTAGTVNVDNCTFTNLHIAILRDSGQHLFVHDSAFRKNDNGIYAQGLTDSAPRLTIESSVFESNTYGMRFMGKVLATVRNTVVAKNAKGIWVTSFAINMYGELLLDNCQLNHNGTGIWVQAIDRGSEIVRLSRSTITNNITAGVLMTANTTVYTLGNNVIAANFPDVSGGVLTPLAAK